MGKQASMPKMCIAVCGRVKNHPDSFFCFSAPVFHSVLGTVPKIKSAPRLVLVHVIIPFLICGGNLSGVTRLHPNFGSFKC